MKKSNFLRMVFAGIAFTTLLLSTGCKKETGPQGPAGPAGAQGATGNANIQSFSVTTNNASWSFDNTDNSYNAQINVSSITADVVNKGTVQVFIGDGTGQSWAALPFSYSNVQYLYQFQAGSVTISVLLSNGTVPSNPGGQQFKVVVIPSAMVKPNVNVHDYKSLKNAYNLND